VNQVPASAELARACATRDILVPVAHGVHPARRPSGVLLLTRVSGFAALGELREFGLEQKLDRPSHSTVTVTVMAKQDLDFHRDL